MCQVATVDVGYRCYFAQETYCEGCDWYHLLLEDVTRAFEAIHLFFGLLLRVV